eukprot:7178393-Prymnesium_polylepis.2
MGSCRSSDSKSSNSFVGTSKQRGVGTDEQAAKIESSDGAREATSTRSIMLTGAGISGSSSTDSSISPL